MATVLEQNENFSLVKINTSRFEVRDQIEDIIVSVEKTAKAGRTTMLRLECFIKTGIMPIA